MEPIYDVGVVGAGIEGSAIAYTLSSLGLRTVLIEQFPLPHTRGSSGGHSRGIRAMYGEKDFMTSLMKDAYKLWDDLEKMSQKSIYKKTGLLYFGSEKVVKKAEGCLKCHDIPHYRMTATEVKKKWDGFNFPGECSYLLDETAGVLNASTALNVYQDLFVRRGGVIRDSTTLDRITSSHDVISMSTSAGSIKCRKLCLAAGPWTNKILSGTGLTLPLQPIRIQPCYWKLKPGKSMDNHPNFIYDTPWIMVKNPNFYDTPFHPYSVMGDEYPGHVKVCPHSGPAIDPDLRDQFSPTEHLQHLQRFVADHLPYLDASSPSIIETCLYTMTPDKDYILDRHPKLNNVFIAAGFSGHGFKMAPIVGRIMADLIAGKGSRYDISHFRLSRFDTTATSKL